MRMTSLSPSGLDRSVANFSLSSGKATDAWRGSNGLLRISVRTTNNLWNISLKSNIQPHKKWELYHWAAIGEP